MVNSLETKSKDRAVLGCPTRAQDGHGFLMEEDPILVPERKEKIRFISAFSGAGHNLIASISSPVKWDSESICLMTS